MARNRPSAPALALTVVLLGGCGGSDAPDVAAPTQTPSASVTPAGVPAKPAPKAAGTPTRTPAAAKDPALAGVLTRADLPGYEASTRTPAPEDEQLERAVYECLGLGAPSYRTSNPGLTFAKGELDVESSANVFAAAARAATVARALDSAKADACFEQALTALFAADTEPSAESALKVAVTRPATKVSGADRAWLQRVVVSTGAGASKAQVVVYQLRALVGRTLVTVRVSDSAGTPSPKEAVRWADKLVARIKAAERP
ncbi:MAG: hypothetical protein ACT4QF_23345 [Sporichthyaceae bacterium]